MLKIPVFSTIGQAMAVFGLKTGRLLVWALVAVLLSMVVGGAFFLTGLAAKALLNIPESRQGVLFLLAIPALFFIMLCWTPFSIRINQLAVVGRVQRDSYLAMVFSGQSLVYLGYGILVHVIMIVGWIISCLPAILTVALKSTQRHELSPKGFASTADALLTAGDSTLILACVASLFLAIVFTVMASPLQLVFPAASVEEHPSLARAYDLGSRNKFRLFWAMFLAAMFFAIISGVLEFTMKHFGADKSWQAGLILFPLNVLLGVFSTVTTTAVPAVAYRVLSGLPAPGGEAGSGQGTPEPRGLLSVIAPSSGADSGPAQAAADAAAPPRMRPATTPGGMAPGTGAVQGVAKSPDAPAAPAEAASAPDAASADGAASFAEATATAGGEATQSGGAQVSGVSSQSGETPATPHVTGDGMYADAGDDPVQVREAFRRTDTPRATAGSGEPPAETVARISGDAPTSGGLSEADGRAPSSTDRGSPDEPKGGPPSTAS